MSKISPKAHRRPKARKEISEGKDRKKYPIPTTRDDMVKLFSRDQFFVFSITKPEKTTTITEFKATKKPYIFSFGKDSITV